MSLQPRHLRTLEFTLLFLVFPFLLYFQRQFFGSFVIPSLLIAAVFCLALLWRDPDFNRRRLWSEGSMRAQLPGMLRTFAVGAVVVFVGLWLWAPQDLFRFPREQPGIWVLVVVLYPLLSVYPQELIFRVFLFHRYRDLFPSTLLRVGASAVTFGLAHLFFANWLAPVLTLFGGWLFAQRYSRSGSLGLACLEHALWGDFLFTIGLGRYFYGGAIE